MSPQIINRKEITQRPEIPETHLNLPNISVDGREKPILHLMKRKPAEKSLHHLEAMINSRINNNMKLDSLKEMHNIYGYENKNRVFNDRAKVKILSPNMNEKGRNIYGNRGLLNKSAL